MEVVHDRSGPKCAWAVALPGFDREHLTLEDGVVGVVTTVWVDDVVGKAVAFRIRIVCIARD